MIPRAGKRERFERHGVTIAGLVTKTEPAFLERSLRIARLEPQLREQNPEHGQAGHLFRRPLGLDDRVRELAFPPQCGGEIEVDEGSGSTLADCFPIARDRAGEVSLALAQHSEIRMRVGAPGIDGDRRPVALAGFRIAPRLGERLAEMHPERRIAGALGDGSAEELDGAFVIAATAPQDAEQVQRARMIGLGVHDFPAELFRPVRVASALMCDCRRQGAVAFHVGGRRSGRKASL